MLLRALATALMREARLALPAAEYHRFVRILVAYKEQQVSKPMAEYMLETLIGSRRPALGHALRHYFTIADAVLSPARSTEALLRTHHHRDAKSRRSRGLSAHGLRPI